MCLRDAGQCGAGAGVAGGGGDARVGVVGLARRGGGWGGGAWGEVRRGPDGGVGVVGGERCVRDRPRAAGQANVAAGAAAPEAFDAIHAEFQAADGLVALPGDARRCHVHYTHCRTDNPDHVQPHDLTREDFHG